MESVWYKDMGVVFLWVIIVRLLGIYSNKLEENGIIVINIVLLRVGYLLDV